MSYKKIKTDKYIADSASDLVTIPEKDMGASCYVINEAVEYRMTSGGKWVKQTPANGNGSGGDIDLTGYATEEYVDTAVSSLNIPSVEGLASEEYVNTKASEIESKIPSTSELVTKVAFEEIASNPVLKAFNFERNSSREDGQAIYLAADDTQTLQEALQEAGLGLYNVWISKGRSQDLPQKMIDNNTSGRGFACVDLQTAANPDKFIGYVVLFDKNDDMYYRFFNKGAAGSWKHVMTEDA